MGQFLIVMGSCLDYFEQNFLIFTFFLSSYAHLTPRFAVTFRRRCELQNNHRKLLINIPLSIIGQNLTSAVFVLGILISRCSDDLSPELSTVSVDKCKCCVKKTLAQCLSAKVEAFQKDRGATKLSREDRHESNFRCREVW